MTKLTSDFGTRVKELRERLHLTQEALAESLGVSFATVNRWENGHTKPSPLAMKQIGDLVDALGPTGKSLKDEFFAN